MSEELRKLVETNLAFWSRKKPDARNFVTQADIDIQIREYKNMLGK